MLKILFSKTAAILLLCAGVGCILAFNIIGSTVDSEGFLHEPFALIPLGGLSLLLGVLIGAVHICKKLFAR